MKTPETNKTIPNVLVLKPITPSVASARTERLMYDNLESTVQKHGPHEYARIRRFFDSEDGSFDEEEAAKQLALHYMLMGSFVLQRAANEERAELWSDRYTVATTEIYGAPESGVARELYAEQETGVEFGGQFIEASGKLGEYLDDTYAEVYDALDLDDMSQEIDPTGIADRFETALTVLASRHDPTWSAWKVTRSDEKDSLSVNAGSKEILVGMRRADVTPVQLKALFTHEILIHAQRAVNGARKDKVLATGLPGYLDAEEGLGVFAEYAMSGELKDAVIDRYVDIAYALGEIDGTPHTRQELLERAMHRADERLQRRHEHKSREDVEKEVYAHVNRIYRGSRGDEHIGVFTKDIAYYKGFLEMGRYIEQRLNDGDDMETVFSYLVQGKFDPTNPAHVAFVEEHSDS